MNYDWNKILSPDEQLQAEFTISTKYIQAITTAILIVGIIACFVSIYAGILVIILGGVYFLYLSRAKHYCFTNKRIVLVDSFFGVSITSIDYSQVTDIEVEQSVIDQFGGWGTLTINTAGNNSPAFRLSFVENPQDKKAKMDEIRDKNK